MSTQSIFIGPDFIEHDGQKWVAASEYERVVEDAYSHASKHYLDGKARGYGLALRDAKIAIRGLFWSPSNMLTLEEVLGAIDSLKEKP